MSILSAIDIEEEICNLKQEVNDLNAELRLSPKGNLTIEKRNGHTHYFIARRVDGTWKKIGITKNYVLLRKLARKGYLKQRIEILNQDIKRLKILSKTYINPSAENVILSLHPRYAGLKREWFFQSLSSQVGSEGQRKNAAQGISAEQGRGDCKTLEKWANSKYETSDYHAESRRFAAGNGIYVRSKSELIIVEKLIEHGVAFHYEEVLHLENEVQFIPDFTIKRADGKMYYWEHFGMMSDEKYREEHDRKMLIYSKNGIGPWDNLIATYDTLDGVVNVREIEWLINNKLDI